MTQKLEKLLAEKAEIEARIKAEKQAAASAKKRAKAQEVARAKARLVDLATSAGILMLPAETLVAAFTRIAQETKEGNRE